MFHINKKLLVILIALLLGLILIGSYIYRSSNPSEGINNYETGVKLKFVDNDRYFPNLVDQRKAPLFFWNNFLTYNKDMWGDNQSGEIKTEVTGNREGRLELSEGQMIWLLYRLIPGTLEFRWLEVKGDQAESGTLDKYWGFGDPSEGFSSGFRLQRVNGKRSFVAETVNMGQRHTTAILFDPAKEPARYYVDWTQKEIRYSIATAGKFQVVATHKTEDIPGIGLPGIMMEISIQNILGDEKIILPLVKYDAKPSLK